MTTSIEQTRNEAWGFWGTMGEHAATAWLLAYVAVSEATGEPDATRAFLDSAAGRHFADEVLNGMHRGQTLVEAIAAAVMRWMGWKISRATSRHHGIPAGLPYLTGFAVNERIADENGA